jgi:hypothetical protein
MHGFINIPARGEHVTEKRRKVAGTTGISENEIHENVEDYLPSLTPYLQVSLGIFVYKNHHPSKGRVIACAVSGYLSVSICPRLIWRSAFFM